MTGEDWTNYIIAPAPRTLLCKFRRRDGFAHTGYARDFHPEFNVAGLEWKLTGIAREQLDRMPEAVRQQVMPMSGGPAHMFRQSTMVERDVALSLKVFDDLFGRIF